MTKLIYTRNHLQKVLKSRLAVYAGSLVCFLVFLFNFQGYSTPYGSNSGLYQERADSYSEFSVRNTVMRNVLLGYSSVPILPYSTVAEDYTFKVGSPEAYPDYYSNFQIQTIPLTLAAKILNLESIYSFNVFFNFCRLLTMLFLAYLLVKLIANFCRRIQFEKLNFLIPVLSSSLVGAIYFCGNLYFLMFLMILPAVYISNQHLGGKVPHWLPIFLMSMIQFLHGFEFFSIYVTIIISTILIFGPKKRWTNLVVDGSKVALNQLIAFISSFILQVFLFTVGDASNKTFMEIFTIIYRSVTVRNFSTKDVPTPFTNDFFLIISSRVELPALDFLGFVKISQFSVIVFVVIYFLYRIQKFDQIDLGLLTLGIFGYASWYVLGYQHIMWHYQYDWYIFALTFGISSILILLRAVSKTTSFLLHKGI
jgi:hypothetical protein